MNIQFIKYEEGMMYCDGTLTVMIDGNTWKFGSKSSCDFSRFWSSGGYYNTDTGDVKTLPWVINKYHIDDVYKELTDIVDDPHQVVLDCLALMNEHVDYGCCGECL